MINCCSIIITHKLNEIKSAANRCSVLRKGKYIGTVDVKTTSIEDMSEMMVGRKISFVIEKEENKYKGPVLEVQNITIKANDSKRSRWLQMISILKKFLL